ncbi:hypothetical protein ES702_02333 [subsurface metagenome]
MGSQIVDNFLFQPTNQPPTNGRVGSANLRRACASSLSGRVSSLSGWTEPERFMPITPQNWAQRVRRHDVDRLGCSRALNIKQLARNCLGRSGLHSALYRHPVIVWRCCNSSSIRRGKFPMTCESHPNVMLPSCPIYSGISLAHGLLLPKFV